MSTTDDRAELPTVEALLNEAARHADRLGKNEWANSAREALRTRAADAGVREALRNLVSKLHKVHQHPKYKAVWEMHQIHYGPYTGLDYQEELKAANLALSSTPAQSPADTTEGE